MAKTEAEKRAMKKYDSETVACIRVRVPRAWKSIITEYVDDNNDKYKSVNDMICQLIKNEIPGIAKIAEKE